MESREQGKVLVSSQHSNFPTFYEKSKSLKSIFRNKATRMYSFSVALR